MEVVGVGARWCGMALLSLRPGSGMAGGVHRAPRGRAAPQDSARRPRCGIKAEQVPAAGGAGAGPNRAGRPGRTGGAERCGAGRQARSEPGRGGGAERTGAGGAGAAPACWEPGRAQPGPLGAARRWRAGPRRCWEAHPAPLRPGSRGHDRQHPAAAGPAEEADGQQAPQRVSCSAEPVGPGPRCSPGRCPCYWGRAGGATPGAFVSGRRWGPRPVPLRDARGAA